MTRTAPFWTLSTRTKTTWTFASAPPPAGTSAILPLLMADVDVGPVDLQNRAARGTQKLELSVHRQAGAAAATIASVVLQASYDDGATWSTVPTSSLGGGRYGATLNNRAYGLKG